MIACFFCRRKDFTIHWEFDQETCSPIQEHFKSVKHVLLGGQEILKNSAKHFPNATELTIKDGFRTPDASFSKTLNRIIPLTKLTKLAIQSSKFSFEQILHLIRFTPNLHAFKFSLLSLREINSKSIEQSEIFQYVSKTNQIRNLELRTDSTLEEIQLIVKLFPRLEYLKIAMKKEDIYKIVRFLLSKTNDLFSLCITEIPQRCLKEFNMIIKAENLLDDYYIKFVNRDLYIWW
jgi:hypothetical protein